MFVPPGVGYDRAVTLFSPDGRLFQVEYAYEAVKKGSTTLGIKTRGGVVLAAEKRQPSRLAESAEKMKKVDEHIGLAFSGLFGDARVLIDSARVYAQLHRLVYGERISVELLAKRICDIKQVYTQHGGVRPFGVAFLIGGVDKRGPQLIRTEPGGSYMSYKAEAIGAGSQTVVDFLEKNYQDDLSLDDAVLLALRALNQVIEEGLAVERVEVAVVSVEDQLFRILKPSELASYIEKLRA